MQGNPHIGVATGDQIFVLGMHRSGTSVVARVLELMSAYFGPAAEAMPPTAANPKGYWERRDFNELNRALMAVGGGAWDRVLPLQRLEPNSAALEWLREAAAPLLAEFDAHRPWFVKEPRLCFTLPYWIRLGAAPVLVAVVRHPMEVAHSLLHRDAFAIETGLALWEAYNLRLLAWMRSLPSVLVPYRRFLEDPEGASMELHHGLSKLGVDGLAIPEAVHVREFYDPSLHRERSDDGAVPEHLQPLWNALHDPSAAGELRLSEESFRALEAHESRPVKDLRLRKLSRRHHPVNQNSQSAAVESTGTPDPERGGLPGHDASTVLGRLAERLDKLERRHSESALATAREELERRELQMLMTRAAEDAVSRALQPQVAMASALFGDRFERWQRSAGEEIGRAVLEHLSPVTGLLSRAPGNALSPLLRVDGPAMEPIDSPAVEPREVDVLRERNNQLAAEADRLAEALGEAKLQLERARAEKAKAEHQLRELKTATDVLGKKLLALGKGVDLLRGTARWRIGNLVVRSIELATFRRRRPTVLDEMSKTLATGR